MTLCSDSTAVTALWPENYDFDSDGQKNGATGFSVFHWTVLIYLIDCNFNIFE